MTQKKEKIVKYSTVSMINVSMYSMLNLFVGISESFILCNFEILYIIAFLILCLEIRMELARKVAACLGIIETKADFFCKSHKPNVYLTRNKCTAGRIVLPILESDTFECRRYNAEFISLLMFIECFDCLHI